MAEQFAFQQGSAQLTATKQDMFFPEALWMARARTSLPTPLSP
jgi:hypothetical protein